MMIAPTRKKEVNQVMLLARETFTFAVSGSTENSSVFAPAQIKRQSAYFSLNSLDCGTINMRFSFSYSLQFLRRLEMFSKAGRTSPI